MPLRGPGEMHFSIVMFVVFHMIVCATGTYWDSQSFPMAPGWREIEGCRCQSTSIQLIFFAIIINIPGAPSTPSEEIVVFDPGDYSEQEADPDENIAQQDNIVQKENVHPKSENSNLAEARTEYNIAVFKRLFFKKFKSLEYISQDGHWKDQIHTNSKCRHQDFLSQCSGWWEEILQLLELRHVTSGLRYPGFLIEWIFCWIE